MATRIRVPWVLDVVLVSEPSEIRALDDEPLIDRRFIPRGPLVNRLIVERIRRWFEIEGRLLPSLLPRADKDRAKRQRELATALDPTQGHALWIDQQLDALSAFVGGSGSYEDMGITVQETVGQLFDPSYKADRASWDTAVLVDRFRNGFSPVQIVWRVTGQLRRAFDLLRKRAEQDRWTMHATAIGAHGIAHALGRMRLLRAIPEATSLSDDAVLARSLAAPKQILRTVEAALSTPLSAKELKPGTLVMMQLDKAMPRAPDAEMIFMRDHWNGFRRKPSSRRCCKRYGTTASAVQVHQLRRICIRRAFRDQGTDAVLDHDSSRRSSAHLPLAFRHNHCREFANWPLVPARASEFCPGAATIRSLSGRVAPHLLSNLDRPQSGLSAGPAQSAVLSLVELVQHRHQLSYDGRFHGVRTGVSPPGDVAFRGGHYFAYRLLSPDPCRCSGQAVDSDPPEQRERK